MSADAKLWTDDTGAWKAVHDGPCPRGHDHYTPYELATAIADVQACLDEGRLRWEFRTYPDGTVGLVGYCS